MTDRWNRWRPRLLLGAFFLLAFLLALRATFPAGAVRQRLAAEAAARGWKVDAGEVAPAGLLGLSLRDVTAGPRGGLAVAVDRIDVTVPLWPLLTGHRRVAVDARLWDGRVRGAVDLAGAARRAEVTVEGVDLARALPLRQVTGMDVAGVLAGEASLELPEARGALPTGTISLTVKDARLGGGRVAIPGLDGGIGVPPIALGELTARLALAAGKGTFERLGLSGGDAEVNADGLSVVLQSRLDASPIFGKLRLRPGESLSARPEGRALRSLLDAALATTRAADGSFAFQLYGTVGRPLARPTRAR